eukprot:UN34371
MKKNADPWKSFLETLNHDMEWSPLSVAVLHPSIEYFEQHASEDVKHLVGDRKKVEVGTEREQWKVLNFPSCNIGGHKKDNYRYLGQVAASVLFADKETELDFKRFLRDNVHFRPLVFEIASKIIARMGMFAYSSFHIRRNELQYKESYSSANNSKHTQA